MSRVVSIVSSVTTRMVTEVTWVTSNCIDHSDLSDFVTYLIFKDESLRIGLPYIEPLLYIAIILEYLYFETPGQKYGFLEGGLRIELEG